MGKVFAPAEFPSFHIAKTILIIGLAQHQYYTLT
jgi:hypothetical protein